MMCSTNSNKEDNKNVVLSSIQDLLLSLQTQISSIQSQTVAIQSQFATYQPQLLQTTKQSANLNQPGDEESAALSRLCTDLAKFKIQMDGMESNLSLGYLRVSFQIKHILDPSSRSRCKLTDLQPELISRIFALIRPEEVYEFRFLSKAFHACLNSEHFELMNLENYPKENEGKIVMSPTNLISLKSMKLEEVLIFEFCGATVSENMQKLQLTAQIIKIDYQDAIGIIFVVDSTNHETIDEARIVLHAQLQFAELTHASLLIFANKQDLPNAMNSQEISDRLSLNNLDARRSWHIQECSATSRDGLLNGMDWLASHCKKLKRRTKI
ncbi:hypothetical protein HK100_010942 [Physocladia obscura]|uniref:F-box domain-containing protein n=1 Tax=Physocladia obscura TaxID=109957 RepID=A0AAD5XHC3_9FUNG|nr:hypothetical protein HK100_010942 [Physocladia obscura]